jgi:hypothetical protein
MALFFKNSPVHFSKGTGKMLGIRSINSNPLSNPFCQRMRQVEGFVCADCYSCRMLETIYKGDCVDAYEANGRLLSTILLADSELPVFKNDEIIRISAHGELINDLHFINICNIARVNHHARVALYTKRVNIVHRNMEYVPENLVLVYSNPRLNTVAEAPAGFHHVFNVFSTDTTEKINCIPGSGSCKACQRCYRKDGAVTITERLKDAKESARQGARTRKAMASKA